DRNVTGVQTCALPIFQAVNKIFVQIAGGGNNGVVESGVGKHLIGFLGEIRQVAAVDTDAVFRKFHAFLAHFFKDADRVGNAGLQHVVGVYQKRAGIGVHFRVCFEGGIFVGEAHDPAVGVSSQHG